MRNNAGVAGTQPVRVLDKRALQWFEEKYPDFRSELESLGKRFGFTRHIRYLCGDAPILSSTNSDLIPYVTISAGQITIHETFLSYVWALSYASMVLFDEKWHGPHTGKQPEHGKALGHFLVKGSAMLDYALSLVTEFNKWPSDLPSPENLNSEDRYYVTKANAVYVAAFDFILCHELAHIACGHLKKQEQALRRGENLTFREIRKFERAADKWALDRVSQGIRPPDRTLTAVGFGVVAGLGSLLLLSQNLTSQTHPDANERVRSALSGLSVDFRDSLWGIAAVFYVAWNTRFNAGLDFSGEHATYGALVQAIDGQLESKKQGPRLWLD